MKFKKFKSLVLLCLFTNLAQAGLSDLLITDPWKFMQEKFITTPNAKATKAIPMLAKLSGGLAAGTITGLSSNFLINKLGKTLDIKKSYDPNTKLIFKLLKFLAASTVSALAGYFSYCVAHNILVSHYQQEELIDLLKNWHNVKSKVPSNLQSAFEKIHKEHKANPIDFANKSDDIIRVITGQINEKFGSKTSSKFWDAKFPNWYRVFDIANIIGSITRIFK